MSSIISKVPPNSLASWVFRRALCTVVEDRTIKLQRIAEELLHLNKLERHDYGILFRHKMGLNRFGSFAPDAAKEKTAFDVKLEKFDASAKLKVIKNIRGFTDLGLKEANDLLEKAPTLVKKVIT